MTMNNSHVDTPAEGSDALPNLWILIDSDDLFIRQDAQSLLCNGRKLWKWLD